MQAEQQHRKQPPLFQNRKSGGSGLGLYIVRQILEQHGAGYELRNTDNGVLFRMKLPLENMTFTG